MGTECFIEGVRMNILLFGVPNVGKTTIGRIVADKLGFEFYDIDEELRHRYHMTQQQFIDTFWNRNTRDEIRGKLIGELLQRKGGKVIAVTPMYYSVKFSKYLKKRQAFGIELQDTPENIFNRLIFTDENDNVCEDSVEYREARKSYYLREIKKTHTFYKRSFSKIENKFQINNDPPELAADRLIEQYNLDIRSNES